MKTGYPLKFRAAVLEQSNQPLVVDEVVFKGPLAEGQVLVRIHFSGICRKQVEEFEASAGPDQYLPHLLGHEGSGVVVEIGSGVTKVKPRDKVVLHWLRGSGINAKPPLYERRGERVNAGWVTTFNEYGVISENRLTPIPEDSDLRVACLLGCAVTTGIGVIFNDAVLRPHESVAIFGCGGVGLNAVQGASLLRGYPIIAVDKNRDNLELAGRFGATHKMHYGSSDVIGEIKKITKGIGVKYVIVATGDTGAVELAAEVSSIPGSVFLVGVPPVNSKVTLDAFSIHMQRRFLGSHGGGCLPDRDINRYLALYEKGHLKLDELITSVLPLDEVNQGISSLISGNNTGRCVIKLI